MFSITIDIETWEILKNLPVTQTRVFKVDDREFSIIDSEQLKCICEMAHLKVAPMKS